MAAASARLCVETSIILMVYRLLLWQPPPRGCVLKLVKVKGGLDIKLAAASARLCVETGLTRNHKSAYYGSRLRAAVC